MSLKRVLLKFLPHLTGTLKLNFVYLHLQSRCCRISVDEGKVSDNLDPLTHWCRDKIAAISQSTLSNAFSWMKLLEVGLKFHWSFFPKRPINNIPALVQLMAWHQANQATSHYLNQWWLDYRRIYASLCLNKLSTNPVHIRDHRPHSRQVTGARCTGGRGSPVMSWILLRSINWCWSAATARWGQGH